MHKKKYKIKRITRSLDKKQTEEKKQKEQWCRREDAELRMGNGGRGEDGEREEQSSALQGHTFRSAHAFWEINVSPCWHVDSITCVMPRLMVNCKDMITVK